MQTWTTQLPWKKKGEQINKLHVQVQFPVPFLVCEAPFVFYHYMCHEIGMWAC